MNNSLDLREPVHNILNIFAYLITLSEDYPLRSGRYKCARATRGGDATQVFNGNKPPQED